MNECIAFSGPKRIASGGLPEVALAVKLELDRDPWAQILIFDDVTSDVIEVDFRGSSGDVLARIAEAADAAPRRPGRPKLGVVAREVTLLPRHWDWLAGQPGGASVALRKLVEQARVASRDSDERRRAQEAAYRFLTAMAGNEPGFEEALRALFAGKRERFDQMVQPWPNDVREHAKKLASAAFSGPV